MDDLFRAYLWQWSSKIWLLLAVISNVSGATFAFSRLLNFPWSLIVTLLHTKLCRCLLFNDPSPFSVDLEISLLLQVVSSFGDTGWKAAFLIAIFSMTIGYNFIYLVPLTIGYMGLQEIQPRFEPGVILPNPLSPTIVKLALCQIYVLNAIFLSVAWHFPSHNGFYSFFQDYVGWFLIIESFVYLSCYKYLESRRNESTQALDGR